MKLVKIEKKAERKKLHSNLKDAIEKKESYSAKETQSENTKKVQSGEQLEDSGCSLKPDYSEVYLSDAWLYFDMI